MATTQIRGTTQIMDATVTSPKLLITADLDMTTHKIVNVVDPINPQDAATRAWVLAQLSGAVSAALTAKAATTANITLSGTQTVDGIALSVNDICLVKNQTTQSQNGVYTVASGAWTRVPGMDTWAEVPGIMVSVQQGTTNADTLWLSTADAGGTLGTTSITFVQIPGPADITAGAGLLRTGQVIDIVAADNSMTINADSIQVKLNAAGAITVSGTGLTVNLESTNPTLQIASNQLGVKLDGAGAIVTGASGIKANVDNTTIEINTNALRVKPGGIGETQLGAGTYLRKVDKITRETPSGSVNGSNTTFTLANTPVAGSEEVFLNGILQEPGAGNDYTISGATITYLTAPPTNDRLRVSYMK
jgi:hypothetical protein